MDDLTKIFSASEISTIQKFVALVADSNQAQQSNFNIAETDSDIKAEVKEWLEKRYNKGHGKRKNS